MKTCVLAVTCLIMPQLLAAQFFYPKAGITLSKVSNSDVDFQSSRPISKSGFTLGFAYSFPAKKNVSFQIESLFVQKGYRTDETPNASGLSIHEKLSLTLNYLEFPVLVKLDLSGGKESFYILTGTSLSYLAGGRYNYYYYENNQGSITRISEKEKIEFGKPITGYSGQDYTVKNRFDFGFQIGTGIKLGSRVFIELRHGIGFVKHSSTADSVPKNRCLQFTIGLLPKY
jgi:hypothetical protein